MASKPILKILVISTIIPFIYGMIVGDPCYRNPCGQNTQCRVMSSSPMCSCLPGYFGNPLSYCQRGECKDNTDCDSSQVCRDHNCVNACSGYCGVNAECNLRNHVAVCSCPPNHTGDPFVSCKRADPGVKK